MISDETRQAMLAHAKAESPLECAGFLLSNGEYFPAKNASLTPDKTVIWDYDDLIAATDAYDNTSVVGFVHSHPSGSNILSTPDRESQGLNFYDWFLIAGNDVHYFPYVPHLLKRKYSYGNLDCFSLIRDSYRLSGHLMEDIEREPNWWDKGQNLYLDNMENFGFERVTKPQMGDVILIHLGGSPKPNHGAVYLGDGTLLHHCTNRLSKRDPYGGYWLKHTHSVWRHKQWQQFDFTGILNDLAVNLPY
jgi:proteasome lid subunit RPN8/RPN11